MNSTPDTGTQRVFVNGVIRTLDSNRPSPEAIAIDGSTIGAVGAADEVMAAHVGFRTIDLDGATLLPSFTDSHTHFKRASAFLGRYIDFDEIAAASIGEVCAAVADRADVEPSGHWIQGDSLNPNALEERRFPTRSELDAVAPTHPVVLRSVGRHVIAANSLALREANIDESTRDPDGGRIERDATGVPTGVLHEEAKLRLDANRADTVIPRDTTKERVSALSNAVGTLSRYGITAIHEMPREPDQISDWLRLYETEKPRLRVRFYVRGLAAQTDYRDVLRTGLRSGFGNEWLKLGGIKFSIDGSGAYRNAMVYDPYPGEPDNLGLQRIDHDEFVDAVRQSHHGGLQIAVHAIGQRAVDMALDAFEALEEPSPDLGSRRHRLEHAYLPPLPGQLERIKQLGLVLSIQASAIEYVGDTWREVFDDEEMLGAVPIRDALELGIPIQLNSDYPCTKLNPFVGVKAAVDRTTKSGHVLDEAQSIGVTDALRMMTRQPAATAFEEGWRGRLDTGMAADMIVVDRDPVSIPAADLDQVEVLNTIVAGETVYEA